MFDPITRSYNITPRLQHPMPLAASHGLEILPSPKAKIPPVMLINGEKLACEACIRGHRVSSCNHQGQPLVRIKRKGRPVSQCQHCRRMRRTRSQHIRCECHQKGHVEEDCPDNMPGGEHIPNTYYYQHTSKCTCALKKEQLEFVLEDFPELIAPKEQNTTLPVTINSCEGEAIVLTNVQHSALLGATNDPARDFSTPALDPSTCLHSLSNSTASPNSQQDTPLPEHFPDSWFMSYEQAHEHGWLPVDWSQCNFNPAESLQDSGMNNNNDYIAGEPASYESFDLPTPGFASPSGGISEVEDYALINRPDDLETTSHEAQNDRSGQDGVSGCNHYHLGSL